MKKSTLKAGLLLGTMLQVACATDAADEQTLLGPLESDGTRDKAQALAEETDTVGSLKAEFVRCDGSRQVIRVSGEKDKFKNWDKNRQIFTVFNFKDENYSFLAPSSTWIDRDCKTNIVGRLVCEGFSFETAIATPGMVRVLAADFESTDRNSIYNDDRIGPTQEAVSSAHNCQAEPGSVRLRHIGSGQCLYAEGGNGGRTKHWGCWDDPGMRFVLDPVVGGGFRLRNTVSGQCLYGNPNDGGEVNHWVCWNDPNMVFDQVTVGSAVRLQHRQTGKCLYANGGNGGTTHVWGCWNDPNMLFSMDPI